MSTFISKTMINSRCGGELDKIRKLYERAFEIYDKNHRAPQIDVRYYPYVGINHTIRIRDGRVFVRIGEICRDMPIPAQNGLAHILVAKLFRKRPPAAASSIYAEFIKSPEIRHKAAKSKRANGRKVITTSKGTIYDLDRIFDSLNREYFHGKIQKPTLTWSVRKTYRILGHHDATHRTIVISKSLDDTFVPKFVVDYVLYHEMLHIAHPTKHINGRRYNHTAAFKRDEMKFAYYEKAEAWIAGNVGKLERQAKRKRPVRARIKKTIKQLVLPFFG
ncbi:MAG: SprT-like domain-containing protein [Acidobacteriota bacterium]